MTKEQATIALLAQYSQEQVDAYIHNVDLHFPLEGAEVYWAKYIQTNERLLHDMELFVEAQKNATTE